MSLILTGAFVLAAVMSSTIATASHDAGGANHWTKSSAPRAWVTYVDFTGSSWPVYASAINWDNGTSRFDAIYQNGSCGGLGHCVSVETYGFSLTCTELAGVWTPFFTSGHFNSDSYVRMNSYCNSSFGFDNRDRQAIACHEMGHAIGLGHTTTAVDPSATCMRGGVSPQVLRSTPRTHDFDNLDDAVYDHSP